MTASADVRPPGNGETIESAPADASAWMAWIGFAIVGVWILVAMFAPAIAPYGVGEIVSRDSFARPGEVGLLGSDYLGRDVLSRLVHGARMTLGLALGAIALAFVIGTLAAFIAALSRPWVDASLSRANEIMLSIPAIMLALVVITALGTSIPVLVCTVGVIEATRVFRIARAGALDVYAMEFVEISIARGENKWWIMWREILPNVMPLLLTDLGTRFNLTILLLASLSFLGLGIQPPSADWGMMVRENLSGINFGAVATLAPAFAIFSLNIALNLIVDWRLAQSNRDISEEMRR